MDTMDAKKSNFDIFAYYIDSIVSKPDPYSQDSIKNLMLISIARSLATIADNMNETK